jgi:hypothetical protein
LKLLDDYPTRLSVRATPNIWEKLGGIYNQFTKTLTAQGIAYEGWPTKGGRRKLGMPNKLCDWQPMRWLVSTSEQLREILFQSPKTIRYAGFTGIIDKILYAGRQQQERCRNVYGR